jgi:transposase
MLDINVFAKLLKLDGKWNVAEASFDDMEMVLRLRLEPPRGTVFPCPVCGSLCKAHDFRERTWRAPDMGEAKCEVTARVPRVDCKKCGKVITADVPWAEKGSGFLFSFEERCVVMAKAMPMNRVAKLMDVSIDTVISMVGRHVDGLTDKMDLSELRRIGVDETSRGKGHDYVTVVMDMDTKKVVFACYGSNFNVIGRFCNRLVLHGGNPYAISDVSCDLDKSFNLGVEVFLPNAKITYDKFHLLSKASEAVDAVRRTEQIKDKDTKRMRYPLLRRPENLTNEEKERLGSVMTDNYNIGEAYRMKESLWDAYHLKNRADASDHLDHWVRWVQCKNLAPFHKVAKLIERHKDKILRWYDSKLNNGLLEGTNSVIQAFKRSARGYRDPQTMIDMIYLRCS